MKLKTKLLLAPLTLSSSLPLVTIAASCSQTDNQYVKARATRTAINSVYSESAYHTDRSNSYGGWSNRNEENLAALLIRKTTKNDAVINNLGNDKYEIVAPSVWGYKLELAGKFIVTDNNGTKQEFDKDDFDVNIEPENGKTYNYAIYQGYSKNPKSINSKEFFKALKTAKKVQIEVKKGVKWVDKKGEETKYEVVAKDFYVSYLRTYSLGVSERVKFAAEDNVDKEKITKLDAATNKILVPNSSFFTNKVRYPNEYLYELFGIESKDFLDESKFLEDDKVTFNKKSTEGTAEFADLIDNLASSQEFNAAPSEYIDEVNKSGNLPNITSKSTEAKFESELVKSLPKDNKLAIAGVYWYGIDPEYTLYAGPYIYEGYSKSTSEEKYVMNTKYADQDWVNSDSSVRTIIQRYQGSGDSEQFKQALWNDFKKGRLTSLPYSLIPTNNTTDVAKHPEKYGVKYYQTLNKSKIGAEQFWNMLPHISVPKTSPTRKGSDGKPAPFDVNNEDDLNEYLKNVTFNDAFSKLLYGVDRKELIKGTVKGEEKLMNLFAGRGLIFRSLITSAFNFEGIAQKVSAHKQKMNISAFALDAKIGGNDVDGHEQENYLRVRYKDINKLSFIGTDYKLSKPVEYQEFFAAQNDAKSELEAFKSPNFVEVKKEMKKLLDEAGIKQNEKVSWTQAFRWVNFNPVLFEQVYKLMPQIINDLDPRLDFKSVKFNSGNELTQFWGHHIHGWSPYTIGGWGYDTNSIGSGFDGMVNVSNADIALMILGLQPTEVKAKETKSNLQKALPELVKMSEALVKFIKEEQSANRIKVRFNVEDLAKLSTEELTTLRDEWTQCSIENGKLKIVNDKQVFTERGAITAKFFNKYVKTLTNEQNIKLLNEFTVYLGVPVESRFTSIAGFVPSLSNKNYIIPFTAAEAQWAMDTKVVVEKTKNNK
ncbi:OppA family ABC transporter substrate-binding lipoprotein [Mycoplasma zalophidermidis]|uniref:OppA family ABC transporter substrate-binding lipoprotein n=1 Tax=Mycoplasma zalophidermidis TaxID=398174 RepID=UPI001C123B51|nr:hypothetical protein [Mycoplasma zalophidermidis]MBU4690008.1 hypothetical protein [Mycoplasma zalophidermidis]MCR8966855.1 hypothetical protein [Mycoplasma zalophidermidis]